MELSLIPTESSACVATMNDSKKEEESKVVELDIFRAPMVPLRKRKPKTMLQEETYVEVRCSWLMAHSLHAGS
jgi:hypothetical protein